tara:strand:- start:72 stop:1121 length:1050 start_codon:yes stop_codon:yes gene_type:complete
MEEAKRNKFPVGKGAALALAMFASSISYGSWYDDGKVLATGGVSIIDGAGGGGITPWATITGYGTDQGVNGNIHYTYAPLANYTLHSIGVAAGFWDRFELSYTKSTLTTGSTFDTVGLVFDTVGGLTGALAGTPINTGIEPFNTTIEMDIIGAKVRVWGEAIYDSDSLMPQIAVGGFYKDNKNDDLLRTLGADKTKDWEAYISATKIFFPINTLVNITARYTAANQTGLVGFGGPDGSDKEIRPEVSLAYLLRKDTVIGVEWAKHGDNLDGQGVTAAGLDLTQLQGTLETLGLGALSGTLTQEESDWYDAFVAYFPSKNLSITAAYAMLGNITLTPDQHGFYLSIQASF